MVKVAKLAKLATTINTKLIDYQFSRQALFEETFKDSQYSELSEEQKMKAVNSACKNICENGFTYASITDEERYSHIAIANYRDFSRIDEDRLIYIVNSINGAYYISTGLYCGVVNLGENLPQLEIRTGYSDNFFKRILNFCCGLN